MGKEAKSVLFRLVIIFMGKLAKRERLCFIGKRYFSNNCCKSGLGIGENWHGINTATVFTVITVLRC